MLQVWDLGYILEILVGLNVVVQLGQIIVCIDFEDYWLVLEKVQNSFVVVESVEVQIFVQIILGQVVVEQVDVVIVVVFVINDGV